MTQVINETTHKAESLQVDEDGNLKVTVEAGSDGGLTDAELRASAVPVSLATTPGLTDTQLRASAVPVSLATTPGLTDAQLRAAAVPVSLASTPGLTDTQLRASAVPVSLASTPGLTDTQLRASAGPVSAASLPLPSGAATEATLAALVAQKAPSALVDRSGSITSGGTAQQLMAANATRRGWYIQNNSDTVMWVSDVGTAAATQPSLKLLPDAYYEPPAGGVDNGAISIFCATTGKTFTAREW